MKTRNPQGIYRTARLLLHSRPIALITLAPGETLISARVRACREWGVHPRACRLEVVTW